MATTYTNNRDGRTITTELSKEEILKVFGETAYDDSWLWFWLTQHAERFKPKTPEQRDTGNDVSSALTFIADLFVYAIGSGLKNPMIRLHYRDRRFKIYLSAKGTVCIKTGRIHPETHDPIGDEEYMGCLIDGRFLIARDRYQDRESGRWVDGPVRELSETEQSFLAELQLDPVEFFAKCSKDMDRCCYCGKALEDERSKVVGYGATCAKHWGLSWGKKGRTEEVPSFADCWQRASVTEQVNVRAMCAAVRRTPTDPLAWNALSDALMEAGHDRRLKMPETPKRMPRTSRA